jgi:hypothetical protein
MWCVDGKEEPVFRIGRGFEHRVLCIGQSDVLAVFRTIRDFLTAAAAFKRCRICGKIWLAFPTIMIFFDQELHGFGRQTRY